MSPGLVGWVSGAVALVLAAGAVAFRVAVATRARDGAERLLAFTTAGLPAARVEWGAAMRAELAAIEEADARRRFARSASVAAFGRGLGLRITVALGTGVAVAVATLIASRLQLQHGGPGVLAVTVPVPAIILLAVAFVSAGTAQSFRLGLQTGVLAVAASFVAVFLVVALEGLVWMERHGVFVLDGDPPKNVVGADDVVFDLISTGLWLGHLIFWLPWLVLGAALGARTNSGRAAAFRIRVLRPDSGRSR